MVDKIEEAGKFVRHRMPELSASQARDAAMHAINFAFASEFFGLKIIADPEVPANEIHVLMPNGKTRRFVTTSD